MEELKRLYEKEQAIKKAYTEAYAIKNQGGEDKTKACQAEYKAFCEEVRKNPAEIQALYRLYSSQQDRGNGYIDIDENGCTTMGGPAGCIKLLKEYGFESFAFSSTWSSAIETAWAFQEAGCTLEKIIIINAAYKDFDGEEFEKIPAYLFKIN